MYLKKGGHSMKKASGVLLLLCCFFSLFNAQVYIGKDVGLTVKDNTLFHTERESTYASVYIEADAIVYNLEKLSNAEVTVFSEADFKKLPSDSSFKIAKRIEKKKAGKQKEIPAFKTKIHISETKNPDVISNGHTAAIALLVTHFSFQAKQGIIQKEYGGLSAFREPIFGKHYLNTKLSPGAELSGIQIRPPPFSTV